MNALRLLAFLVATLAAGAAGAQKSPAPADEAPLQPGLVALVAPRDAELRAAGVTQIIARTGKARRDIQVLTDYGPSYLGWPKNVAPVTFEIYFNTNAPTTAFAHEYSEANKAKFQAALDAIAPLAVRAANTARANRLRPRA
jgi:hypothetical protein